jgi:hypothetical protein
MTEKTKESTVTFRTVVINKENFLRVINPDQQVQETSGYMAYHAGIYGNKTDNGFFDLCIDLYTNGAGAHQNLVNLKANLILGNNLQAEDNNDESKVDPFIAKRNKAGENLKVVYARLAKDFALFNGCVLQVVFNREGKIAECYHVPMQNFRLGKQNKYGRFEYGYISQQWSIIQNSRVNKGVKDMVKIRLFDPTDYQKHPVQLLYLKDYSYTPYAVPSYTSAINWILVSREISDFHLNNIKSNFFLGGMLTIPKNGMSPEQIEENAQQIERIYKGGTGMKLLLQYTDDMTNGKGEFEKFSPDDQDKMWDILAQQSFQQIVTAHQSYPMLAGADNKGSGADLGGDANKLITTLASFNSLVTEGYKQIIVDGINRIMEINELPPVIVITEMPKITQPKDNGVLTVNEIREMLYGLPEIDSSVNNVAPTNTIPAV